MKLSIAIADTHALDSAFVVFRGFEKYIPRAASLGYDGVELALRRVTEIDERKLERLLTQNNLEVSCISTGQVYADGGLILTHDDSLKRTEVLQIFKEFIDLASNHGRIVNIGRVRGSIGDRSQVQVQDRFRQIIEELCNYALAKEVILILEPVNRYECDFINTVEEGVNMIKEIGAPNLKLLPDVFHMNIEEIDVSQELLKHIDHINYLHMADSNRLAPGQGHTDFDEIFGVLEQTEYDGWISIEILPRPTPEIAASQAIEFLKPRLKKLHQARSLSNQLRRQ